MSDFLNAVIINGFPGGPLSIFLPAPSRFAPPVDEPGDNRGIKVGFLFLDRPDPSQPLGTLPIDTPANFPTPDANGNPLAGVKVSDRMLPSLTELDLLNSGDATPANIGYQDRSPRFTAGWQPIAQDGTTTILVYYCSPRPGPGVMPLNGIFNDPEGRGPSILAFGLNYAQSLTALRPRSDYNLQSPLFPNPFVWTPLLAQDKTGVEINTGDQSFNYFGVTAPSFVVWRSSPPLRYLGLDTLTTAMQLYQRSLSN